MRAWTLTACAVMTLGGVAAAAGPDQTNTATATHTDYKAFCERFAGEWEGQIEFRENGKTSASIASASNRFEQGASRFVTYTEGFAFGKPVEFASVVKCDDGKCSYSEFTAVSPVRAVLNPTVGKADGVMIFRGTRQVNGTSQTIEQRFASVSSDHYTVEVFEVASSGAKELLCKLDMHRLPEGQVAAASDMFRFSEPVQQARAAFGVQASVTTDE